MGNEDERGDEVVGLDGDLVLSVAKIVGINGSNGCTVNYVAGNGRLEK